MNQILLSSIELDQLDELIQRSIRQALAGTSSLAVQEPCDRVYFDEACQLLNRSKSWLFKKTMQKDIPFSKFGSRLVFSRKDLLSYMEGQTIPAVNPGNIMSDRLAAAANKKRR